MIPHIINSNYDYFASYKNTCLTEQTKFIECMKKPIGTQDNRTSKESACKDQLDKFCECIRHTSHKHIR